MKTIHAADLFCGGGGTSTGLARACERFGVRANLLAINHWPVAVETHAKNHPWAEHVCARVDSIDPRSAVPSGKLDLLVASPECVHFSTARGGRPMCDQSRASAWHVLHWAEHLQVDTILVENVREFESWGPLGRNGRPMKSRRGETFRAWVEALRSLGYRVDWRVLNAADYGDATTRRRLFVLAWRGRRPVAWPEPSHTGEAVAGGMFADDRAPWRAAREVIDWKLPGESIFGRKRPLAPKTLARIEEGIRRFGGANAEPFLVLLRGTGSARSVDKPLPAITAGGTHLGLCEPFVLSQQSGGAPRAVSEPMPTVAAKGAIGLVEPFLVPGYGEREGQAPRTHSIDEPVPAIPASSKFGLVEPFLLHVTHGGRVRSIDQPVPTITAANRGELGVVHTAGVDIRFRMLQPHELSAAMGFPDDYEFAGTKTDAVKQIGNAVAVGVAEALCSAALRRRIAS